jgi:RNA recognition motif-containing protein
MNIYVGNLPPEVTEEELEREFMAFGKVNSVTIMDDKYIGSGQPRAYGYVEMPSRSEAAAAIAGLSGKKMYEREVSVVEALPLSNKSGLAAGNVKYNNRYNRSRERRYNNS